MPLTSCPLPGGCSRCADQQDVASLEPMTFVSLFAGIGGLDLGLERAGMRCIAQVEIDPFCRRVLAKHWPDVPKFNDVREFNRGSISDTPDLICGGFPCQDITFAGKRAGIDGDRSGLWREFHRIVRDFRPRCVLVENSAALLVPIEEGQPAPMSRVLGDLAACGFDAEWSVLPACALGAPHTRERVFVVAYSNDSQVRAHLRPVGRNWRQLEQVPQDGFWKDAHLPMPMGVANGIPERMDRLGGLGNAVVPQVAEWVGRRIVEAHRRAKP